MTLYYGMITLCSILTVGLTDRNELVATADCICLNQNFTYECTVFGDGVTIWNGTVFMADCDNNILLHHNVGETGRCNNGDIVGQSIEVGNNSSRSALTIYVKQEFNGKTVICSADMLDNTPDNAQNISTIIIGNTTLSITTEPFSSPTNVRLVQASPTELVFNWTAPTMYCPSQTFIVDSQNCGTCQNNSSSLNTTCRNYTHSSVCTLRIISEICGNLQSDSSSTVTVNLTGPSVKVIPYYSEGENTLLRLVTNFSTAVPLNIYDEIDGSVTYYRINYTDHNSGTICRSAIINATECMDRFCSDVFEVSSSPCCFMTNISVTLLANYILGEVVTFEETKDGINKFVDVAFIPSSRSIKCSFYKSSQTGYNCSVDIYYGTNCNNTLVLGLSTGNELVTPSINFMDDTAAYCFEITASSAGETVVLKGTLNVINTGNQHQLIVSLAVVATISCILCIVVIILAALLCCAH